MTELSIAIDASSSVAPYAQLRRAIGDQARDGSLPFGTQLPTVRGLAAELGLATNTVARAYRELESDGVIETRGRGGTVVAWLADAAERRIHEAAVALVAQSRELGIPDGRVLAIVDAALGVRAPKPGAKRSRVPGSRSDAP